MGQQGSIIWDKLARLRPRRAEERLNFVRFQEGHDV